MFDLFDLKEVVCHGNGLIIDGCGIEENLLWETEYLQLQIRGDENKTILYVPRFTEVSYKRGCVYSKYYVYGQYVSSKQ